MVVAGVAAVIAPFHLFLLAYAVLGPLHYLTEIAWLHDREFFAPSVGKRHAWLFLVAMTAGVLVYGYVASDLLGRAVSPNVEIGMFYLVFAGALVVLYVRHPVNVVAIVAIISLALAVFAGSRVYGVAAYLLVTIIHVFVFTAAFLIQGALRANRRSGYVSSLVFIVCAVATLVARTGWEVPGPRI